MPYKIKRPPKSYDIEVLSLAVAALGKEVNELEATNANLSFKHSILHATCEILQLLGAIKQVGQPCSAETELLAQLQGVDDAMSSSRITACESGSIHQLQLQQVQLAVKTPLHSVDSSINRLDSIITASDADTQSLLDLAEDETLGTLKDPLRSLRLSLQRQSAATDVDSLTLRGLQADYQETVNQLALNIAFLDNPFRRSQNDDSNPYNNIKKLLTRHGQLLTSLLVGGKAHFIPQFMMSDVITGEQQEEHSIELYDHAVQRLGLSQEQMLRMQATLHCFQGLLSVIIEERKALQQKLGLPPGLNPAATGCYGSSSGSSPHSSMSSGMLQAAAAAVAVRGTGSSGSSCCDPSLTKASKDAVNKQQQAARQEQHAQQHKLEDMVKFLKKESLLKCCTWVGVEGCLTWIQLAKLAMCCYPHPASPIALAQAVDRHIQQQHQ